VERSRSLVRRAGSSCAQRGGSGNDPGSAGRRRGNGSHRFRGLLEAEDDIDVVGEADDFDQILELVGTKRPRHRAHDVRVPGTDRLQATRQIISDPELNTTKIIILTTFQGDEYPRPYEEAPAGSW
jgi:hypothetical protein